MYCRVSFKYRLIEIYCIMSFESLNPRILIWQKAYSKRRIKLDSFEKKKKRTKFFASRA